MQNSRFFPTILNFHVQISFTLGAISYQEIVGTGLDINCYGVSSFLHTTYDHV